MEIPVPVVVALIFVVGGIIVAIIKLLAVILGPRQKSIK